LPNFTQPLNNAHRYTLSAILADKIADKFAWRGVHIMIASALINIAPQFGCQLYVQAIAHPISLFND
jgi:hypothetical protein